MVKQVLNNGFLKFLGVIIFIALWWAMKLLFFAKSNYMPAPLETFEKCFDLFADGKLHTDLLSTLSQFFQGFLLAAVIGIPVGLLLGYFKKGYSTFEVIIDFFRSIPVTALFPIFILFFGIGSTTITAMVAVASFWVILINSAYGVIYANATYLKVMDSFRATTWQKFTEVIFYEALPFLFVGLRVAVSFGLIVVIVSEMFIGSQFGLGARVYRAYETYLITDVYAITIIIGSLGYLLNKLLFTVEKKIVHWKGLLT